MDMIHLILIGTIQIMGKDWCTNGSDNLWNCRNSSVGRATDS